MLRFQIVNEEERKEFSHAAGPIEFGRGPERPGKPRFVIRDLYVSKDQACLEKLSSGLVRVQNLSTKQPIVFGSSQPISPGDQRDCTLPLRFTVGETTVDVEDAAFDVIQRDLLASIEEPVRTRRSAPAQPNLKQLGDTPEPAKLLQWFETVVAVQKAAAGAPEFYEQTAQALIDLVGLDRGLVLLREGGAWQVAARAQSDQESQGRDFSLTILQYVLTEKRTFYQATLSGPVSESLANIEAVVASPIFDAETEVIGVLYGSRGRHAKQLPTVGPLEAQVVQLLASTLGVGLARLQHMTEAARMRVGKETAEIALAKEQEYLRNVTVLTDAAAAVEAGRFEFPELREVAERTDALGQLARMFEKMVKEVQEREAKLKEQVQQLRIEIDQGRKERQVAEITETDYFYELQQKAANLRRRSKKSQAGFMRVDVMSKIVSVHSFRGGTGKSNLTANVATMVALHGKRVGIVDTDIQSPGIHVLFGLDETRINRSLNDYLWGQCAIEDTAYNLAIPQVVARKGSVYLVPSSIKAAEIAKVLREGYDVGLLNDGFQALIDKLNLDYLFIDTHPGLNEETLLSIAISDVLVLILRPDKQDFQGTAVTVEIARKLQVPNLFLVVNKALPSMEAAGLRQQVEYTYNAPVAGILHESDDMLNLASGGLISLLQPNHQFTREVFRIAQRIMAS